MHQITPRLINWASILEENTREQALRTASMPFIYPHLALMPDAHLGKGATVGSVIPTLGAIIPAAVGVDIGCGMIAVRTQFTATTCRAGARCRCARPSSAAVPLSAGRLQPRDRRRPHSRAVAELEALAAAAGFDPAIRRERGGCSSGTLGSGNHFIEVTLDEAGRVWLFLHSGSRGVGNKIAQHHIKVAQRRCASGGGSTCPTATSPTSSRAPTSSTYIGELRWAQHFALLNREEMMDRVVACARGESLGRRSTSHERDQLPPQLHRAGAALRQAGVAFAQGRHRGAGGPARADPGLDGHRVLRRRGQGQRRRRCSSAPHGAGPRVLPQRGRARPSPSTSLREAMAGIEYRDTARSSTRSRRLQGHRPGHGRRRRPGRDPPHAAPDRQRQGRLTEGGRADTTPRYAALTAYRGTWPLVGGRGPVCTRPPASQGSALRIMSRSTQG